jgi:ubiquinone/menaquinone biosynthesis C-methylase UbiE
MNFEQKWRERFQQFANKQKSDAGIAGWSTSGLEARLLHFKTHWQPGKPGSLWLDAGCGAGTYTRYLTESGMQAVGLDYSLPSLLKARERSADSIRYLEGDVTALPFPRNSFDGVLCFGVTQALSETKTTCAELVRVVRPGGQVWLDGLNCWCLPNALDTLNRRYRKAPRHLRHENPYEVLRLSQTQGLTNLRLLWLPILPARLTRFQWLLETSAARRMFRHTPLLGMLLSHSFVIMGEKL